MGDRDKDDADHDDDRGAQQPQEQSDVCAWGGWRSPRQREAVIDALRLTPRQADVLDQIMLEKDDKQVAAALGLKVTTVRTHLRQMCRNCGGRTVKGLLVRVLRLCNGVG